MEFLSLLAAASGFLALVAASIIAIHAFHETHGKISGRE